MWRRPLNQLVSWLRPYLIRNSDATELLEAGLVSAVATVLVVRAYLKLAGYPQLGTGGLHVAHVLWGGLLMLAALVILLAFLGRDAHRVAAIVGGVGFGMFLDEVGKFLTHDNNYFYRPAIAIIYVVFILLFVMLQSLRSRDILTKQESLANALRLLGTETVEELTPDAKAQIMQLLNAADPHHPLTRSLKRYMASVTVEAPQNLSLVSRITEFSHRLYVRVVSNRWFTVGLIALFLVQSGAQLIGAVGTTLDLITHEYGIGTVGLVGTAQLGAAGVAGIFAFVGAARVRWSRLSGYEWFQRSVLIEIFVTQVFVFYNSQLAALGGLAWDVVVWGTIRFAIAHELTYRERAAEEGEASGPSLGVAAANRRPRGEQGS